MDWKTAPLTACLDFLAECKGNKRHPNMTAKWITFEFGDGGVCISDHPIPATLDSIAGCLPDGFEWEKIMFGGVLASVYACRRTCEHDLPYLRVIADADTEGSQITNMILAMARAACMAWEASMKEKP